MAHIFLRARTLAAVFGSGCGAAQHGHATHLPHRSTGEHRVATSHQIALDTACFRHRSQRGPDQLSGKGIDGLDTLAIRREKAVRQYINPWAGIRGSSTGNLEFHSGVNGWDLIERAAKHVFESNQPIASAVQLRQRVGICHRRDFGPARSACIGKQPLRAVHPARVQGPKSDSGDLVERRVLTGKQGDPVGPNGLGFDGARPKPSGRFAERAHEVDFGSLDLGRSLEATKHGASQNGFLIAR